MKSEKFRVGFAHTHYMLISHRRSLFFTFHLKMFLVKQQEGQTRKPAPPAVDVGVEEKDMVS